MKDINELVKSLREESTNILTKGLQSDLDKTPISDGALRYTTDTGCLFLDIVDGSDSRRVKFSDIVDTYTEAEIFNIIAPLPKVYLAKDTHRAYVSTATEWIDIAAINLRESTDSNVDIPLLFTDDENTIYYKDNLVYNTSQNELKVPNVRISDALKINNFAINCYVDEMDNSNIVEFGCSST